MHGNDSYGYTTTSHGGGFITGMLVGTAVGAAIGLLLAPKTGAEMRRTIASSADKLRQRAGETYSQASSAVGDLVEKGRSAVRQGRDRVESAIDEARNAYEEETSANRDVPSRPY